MSGSPLERQGVLVVDFGAQYAQLIARRVREARVYSEIVPWGVTAAEVRESGAAGLILSGGPKSVHEEGSPLLDAEIYDLGVPILGICYGAQLLAQSLGGEVDRSGTAEYGRVELQVLEGGDAGADRADSVPESVLITPDIPRRQQVWMSHFDSIAALPPSFCATASTQMSPAAAFESPERALFGVQFHPEVHHTEAGQQMIENFLYEACGCSPDWTPQSMLSDALLAVSTQIGDGRAVCGLSGGVDSMVAAALVRRAIGDRLTCVFVDTGLMREGEGEQVVEAFGRSSQTARIEAASSPAPAAGAGGKTGNTGDGRVGGDTGAGGNTGNTGDTSDPGGPGATRDAEEYGALVYVSAGGEFMDALAGVTDPEAKRKIIGERFVRIFEREALGSDDAKFLVQGTLYPDFIESGGGQAALIKSHHNVGGLPENMELELVEPLRKLFKDEVRMLGEELGLPPEVVWRHPFPGPGLAVRIVGEVTPERVEIVRAADAIVRSEITRAGLEREVWQVLAVLLDVRTVGVMGDERTYGHPIVIRAVTSEDAMTADWARLPHDVLESMASRIVAEVPGVNRVVYDVTTKPPGTIEWE